MYKLTRFNMWNVPISKNELIIKETIMLLQCILKVLWLYFLLIFIDCSFTPVNFSIIQNVTNTYTSNIRIKWSNPLKINSTYYVNTSILSENSMNTVFTDNAYVDLMIRPGVSYTIIIMLLHIAVKI